MNEEQTWIFQAQQGNDEAFTRLVEQYQTPVFNLCYRMLGEPESAEDAAQESFLRAYHNISRYDRQRPFATWLLSIAAHYCIDRLRRRRFAVFSLDAEREEDDRPAELPDRNAADPEEEAIRREEQEGIQAALRGLEATDRAAIVLRYWYDFSEVEIAASLNLTVSAVKSRLHRARKAVARLLTAQSPETRMERMPYGSPAV
ncbi:MAG: sigma-70 family RNA polymerase sigma factor [Anaerolineales bacterium]|nr:sigma-70 family RNA polymerase sigma factor [Anaerolineales bacterium]MCX7754335.1 sigma-70 family RNA polymerase sigma factor [Anaerolineales bacterium]MDW8279062.1 sigma-70 family RNA polymerase sigma factor [Anaerolineales bacterium]